MIMIITCWGSRGSIPVSGKHCVKYGGDTTCLEIQTSAGEIVIIDAGTGIRELGNRLIQAPSKPFHLMLTHAHWDHVIGFPFFKPLYSNHHEIIVHTGPFTSSGIQRILSYTMMPPHFPVSFSHISARLEYRVTPAEAFHIGGLTVIPIPISHPNSGYGYKFIEDGKVFVFLTDNELGFTHPTGLSRENYIHFCAGAKLLIHDAEYTPDEYRKTVGWGHSVYTETLSLAGKAGVGTLGLFHLNQDRTDRQMDGLVKAAHRHITEKGYEFDCMAVGSGMRFEI
jgi:phosphoribosyl 1,2-cyclic phosphodiesterase